MKTHGIYLFKRSIQTEIYPHFITGISFILRMGKESKKKSIILWVIADINQTRTSSEKALLMQFNRVIHSL